MRTATLAALVAAGMTAGCLFTAARTDRAPAPSAPLAGVEQTGQANLSGQLVYHSDLPWKAVLLLVSYVVLEAVKQTAIVYLSHRREMTRLSPRATRCGETRKEE